MNENIKLFKNLVVKRWCLRNDFSKIEEHKIDF